MAETQQSQNPGLLANILAVAGFIILIVIIVWGAYHLLKLTGSGVSSLFSRFRSDANSISITVPTSPVQSGKSFPLSWKYTPKENGSYAFLYQCKSGFRFDVTTPAGTSNSIPCGSAYTVGAGTSISLVPVLSSTTTTDIPLSIVFIPSATSTAASARPQGTATVTVTAGSGTTPATSSNTGTTPKPTTPKPVATGTPDLSVRVLAVGVIDPVTGVFAARYPTSPNDIAAVKFDIANNGAGSTGTWYFTVQLPIQSSYLYSSPAQMNLAPGSHIENILRFRPVVSGGGNILIQVDPSNMVRESNESNNAVTQFIAVPAWTGTYQPYVY